MEKKKNISEVETTEKSNVTAAKQTAYQQSDVVKQAQAMLQQQAAQKPGAYQSPWQNQLNDVIGKIMNRENFSYDLNGDALYQQYKDRYITQGRMAMMDAMGQAAALTGGYGNSYAQSVGQQAYHGYLQGLNDKVPELYQLALSKYQMEGDQMRDKAALAAQMENQDYGRYRDQVGDYNTELDRLQNRYDTERNFDYGQYVDDRNYLYQLGRDAAADAQWQKEFDEAKRQYDQQFALKNGGSTGGSGGSRGTVDDTGGEDPYAGEPEQEPVEDVKGLAPVQKYDTVVKDLEYLISAGYDTQTIDAYLKDAHKYGYVSDSQYQNLKNNLSWNKYTR